MVGAVSKGTEKSGGNMKGKHLANVGLAGDVGNKDATLEAVLVGRIARQQGNARVQNGHKTLAVIMQPLHKCLHAHSQLPVKVLDDYKCLRHITASTNTPSGRDFDPTMQCEHAEMMSSQ